MKVPRRKERAEVLGKATVRTARGTRVEVDILDLSEIGCRIASPGQRFEVGEPLTLKIDQLGPFEGEVKWVENRQAGLEFKLDMYGPVWEHLREKLAR